jgi:hypothetical protein
MSCMCPLTTPRTCTDILSARGLASIRGGELDLAAPTFRSALASRSRPSSASAGDGVDGESAGDSTVESFSAAILGPSVAERFITMPPLCTEIIEDSLPRMVDTERAGLPVAGMARPQVADMRVHLEATPGRPAASPAAIVEQPLTEPTQVTADSPAARPVPVVSAAAAAARRADPLRTVADTLAVVTTAVEVTTAADTAVSAKRSV